MKYYNSDKTYPCLLSWKRVKFIYKQCIFLDKIPLNSIVTYRLFFSTEIVSDILARVSDKNPPNIYEETPLHRAAKNGHDRCIEGSRILQFWILKKVNPYFFA